MSNACGSVSVALIIALYLLTAIGDEFLTHADGAISLHSQASPSAITSQRSGYGAPPHEQQICLACAQTIQRISTPPALFDQLGGVFICTGVISLVSEELVHTDRCFSVSRAPPLSL